MNLALARDPGPNRPKGNPHPDQKTVQPPPSYPFRKSGVLRPALSATHLPVAALPAAIASMTILSETASSATISLAAA